MYKKIQFFVLVLIVSLFVSSCRTRINLTDVGRLTIASTKNAGINDEYVLLARNAGFDESQVTVINGNSKVRSRDQIWENYNKLKSTTIEGAINNVVEGTPGGAYMENVEVYSTVIKSKKIDRKIRKGKMTAANMLFIVSGDVYGLVDEVKQIRGFVLGSKAFYKKDSGVVATLIDDQYCLWKNDRTEIYEKVLYDDLIKIGE